MKVPVTGEIVDLTAYRKELGEARQRVQIQQSLRRLSQVHLTEITASAIAACKAECLEKGIDTSKEGFIQDMETLTYLMQGVLENTIALETDNGLMIGAVGINIRDMLEVEAGGKG